MITSQLEDTANPKTPADLADTIHGLGAGSLLFTLENIASGATDNGYACPKDSPLPTLRISFEQRSIIDVGSIHGTRSQCVLGLHRPEDKVCYSDAAVLTAAESTVPKIASGEYTPDDAPTLRGDRLPDVDATATVPFVDRRRYQNTPISGIRQRTGISPGTRTMLNSRH